MRENTTTLPLLAASACAVMMLGCGRLSEGDVVEAGGDAGETSGEAAADSEASEAEPQPDTDRSCAADGGCVADEYCDLSAPSATNFCKAGTCKVRPTAPSLELEPICGCDGVTYWNAEQAAAHGVSVGFSSECVGHSEPPSSGECTRFDPTCPVGTRCVLHLLGGFACDAPDVSGLCWSIPSDATCPSGGGGYRDCTTSTCTNLCGAIKSEVILPDGKC